MDDLISRQAAIESAESCCHVYGDDAGYRIVEELRELPTAQTEQWIPVTERLPEEDLTDVLLLYHDKRCGCEDDDYIMQAYTVRGQWRPALRIDDSDMDGLEPVAWMPLPAPYKED